MNEQETKIICHYFDQANDVLQTLGEDAYRRTLSQLALNNNVCLIRPNIWQINVPLHNEEPSHVEIDTGEQSISSDRKLTESDFGLILQVASQILPFLAQEHKII